MKRRGVVATAVCVVAFVAGCDDVQTPSASPPMTTPAPTSQPVVDEVKAPRVEQPLDAAAFVADPCKSLTDVQVKKFALDAGQRAPSDAVPGETCAWDNDAAQISVDVTYQPELTAGLSHLYQQHAAGQYDVWEPTEVGGHPAIHLGERSLEEMGDCDITVGLSDSLFFRATVSGNEGDDSCTAARNVASAVLDTIKAGG